MAGGGVKPGIVYGETDDFSYNIVRDPVSLHDLDATMLHCLGIDHAKSHLQGPGPRSAPHGRRAGAGGSGDSGVRL